MLAGPSHTSSAHSDWLLVQRTLAGDMRAFELLVLKYQQLEGPHLAGQRALHQQPVAVRGRSMGGACKH